MIPAEIVEKPDKDAAFSDLNCSLRASVPSLPPEDPHADLAQELIRTKERLEAMISALPDLMFRIDRRGRIQDFHSSALDKLYLPPDRFLGRLVGEVLPPEATAVIMAALEEAALTGRHQGGTYRLQLPQGELWYELSMAAMGATAELPPYQEFVMLARDITQRQHTEQVLRESEECFRRLFEDTYQANLLIEDGRFIAANRAALKMLRMAGLEQLVGRTPAELSPPQQPDGRSSAKKAEELIRIAYAQGSSTFEWEYLRADGEPFPAQVLVTVIRYHDKDLLHNVWTDITEQKQAREQIEFLAYHDPLTGLPNRVLGQDQLGRAIATASRHRTSLAVLYLDLDKFKYVNDTYGHPVGDRLLKGVAQRLSQALRANDNLCRLSGDEFMVILPDLPALHPVASVAAVCDRILASLAVPFDLGAVQHYTAFSIGVAVFPQGGRDSESLMRNADTALYSAKKAGQHSYCFFEPQMNAALTHYVQTREGLRLALARQELELHYQPQIDLRSGGVVGVEALIRWRQLGADLLVPGTFLGAAEESGLIVPIGRWVLQEACRQAAAWHRMGWGDLSVAVNLSAVQFRHPQIVEDVLSALASSGLDTGRLDLELIESLLVQHAAVVQETVATWKARGIQVSIDDFGTGYSSLTYLKHFKVDKLKIDRSFIIDIVHDEEACAIVKAMIQIARSLKLKTIAEGVEDAAQAEQLKIMGCDQAQGYFYTKPLPAADLEQWLRDHQPHP